MKKSMALIVAAALLLAMFTAVESSMKGKTEGQDVSVCIVVDTTFGDTSINDSALEGGELMNTQLGVKLNTIECANENYKQNLTKAAQENNIVVAVGWEFTQIKEVANEYPAVNFVWVDNVVYDVESCDNLVCLTYRQNEGSFLAGYIAAKLSQNNAVGVVGGEETNIVNDFIAGFEQGAKYANDGISVYTEYIGEYEDTEKAYAAANNLRTQGADIIYEVAGRAGQGVFKAAKDGGFTAIGVDVDQKIALPEYDEVIACSMKKDIGSSIYVLVNDYIESGEWNGGCEEILGIADGYISMVYGSDESVQLVDDDTKKEVETLSSKIANGSIDVDSALDN